MYELINCYLKKKKKVLIGNFPNLKDSYICKTILNNIL